MLLRIKLFENDSDTELFELTLNNCNYQDFKNHFTGFAHTKPFKAKFYTIDNDGTVKEIASHIL